MTMTILSADDTPITLNPLELAQAHGLRFPILGQGTVSVSSKSIGDTLRIVMSNPQGNAVGLTIGRSAVEFWARSNGATSTLLRTEDAAALLDPPEDDVPYWLSLDSHNKRLRYGKGEMLGHLKLLEFSWADDATRDYTFVKSIQSIDIEGAQSVATKLLPIPVTIDPPPIIISGSAITMEILAGHTASVINDLPTACHRLYENVAGPGITLSPADFPDFARAIQYSINAPTGLCYKKLQTKEPQFGYLRVTLDANMGDSPGQPYVLEIWPAGNGSPIHHHGNACAVIKVLHGAITVAWFSALNPRITEPWGSMTAQAGDVTFLTPDYYQIHQLHNPAPRDSGDFCATIQCYRYADEDSQHYEYFDYVDGNTIGHFDPDSDWEYLEFKEAIRQEWTDAIAAGRASQS